jgi:peptidoglycan hydrolase-like protein with peptidoglycan-binding domain
VTPASPRAGPNADNLRTMVSSTRTAPRPLNSGRDPNVQDETRPVQTSAADDDVVPYTVRRGDTLEDIARRHDCSLEELLELNPAYRANPNKIRLGATIDVPAADKLANKPQRVQVPPDVQTSSRQRAAANEQAIKARVEGPYSTPAPPLSEVPNGARIRRGMSGESVVDLQKKLNAAGATPPLALDGKFGPKTEAALKRFQAERGIQQTGVLGDTTWKKLENARPIAPEGSGGRRTSGATLASIDGVPAGPLAQRIGDAAEREARRMNTTGRCALGVNNALISLGIQGRGHAYQKAEQLARNRNFREVSVSRDQLDNLPRGAVVVWGRSNAKPWGHVTVSLGDGREASDHIQRMIVGGRYGTDFGRGPDPQGRQFRVFMPVG